MSNIKAVIMAGGKGTRLRAVTGGAPKPLCPLLGRTVIEHIILLLKQNGFEDICISLGYRGDDIENALGDGSEMGVRLSYRREAMPLGTAGGVKNCRDFYGEEDFLVISGDAVCDFDLRRLMDEHRRRGSAVTIALSREQEPLPYGLVITDENMNIRAFIEKPDWDRVVTDLINTGIYVISPRVMELVPENSEFDFAKGLFPLLLERNEMLTGIAMDGYWCDIGTPLAYYRCCVDALTGRLRLNTGGEFEVRPEAGKETPICLSETNDTLYCPCRSRAELMGALSELLWDMGCDYTDGLRLHGKGYVLRIAPLSSASALSISVSSQDAEFSHSLALSAKNLAQALDL